jgi:FixJ family two-component response regulator
MFATPDIGHLSSRDFPVARTRNRLLSASPLICVIDDDDSVRVSLEGLLRSLGHRVRAFESATAFMVSTSRAEADCVISDVQMPGMTGVEMKEAMIAAGEKTPVILITAFADETQKLRAEKAGVTCFLPKPFTGQKLIDCLNRALIG